MGELANTAKKNSNFFKIERGQTEIVTFLSYRVVPNSMDPSKESVQYKFRTPFGEKYWTNGNSAIMMFFDDLKGNELVQIKRDPWINKDGSEDNSKSAYKVSLVPDVVPRTVEGYAPQRMESKPINADDIAWDA